MNQIEKNRAHVWQIALFSLNNTSTNLYLAMMGYISYYANGIAGLGVVLISMILTGMRIFDLITDPLIGFIIDKTNGRFGKFRPYMIIGYILLAASSLTLFFTTHSCAGIFEGSVFYTDIFCLYYRIYISDRCRKVRTVGDYK